MVALSALADGLASDDVAVVSKPERKCLSESPFTFWFALSI